MRLLRQTDRDGAGVASIQARNLISRTLAMGRVCRRGGYGLV
jgi:hypothetical protein